MSVNAYFINTPLFDIKYLRNAQDVIDSDVSYWFVPYASDFDWRSFQWFCLKISVAYFSGLWQKARVIIADELEWPLKVILSTVNGSGVCSVGLSPNYSICNVSFSTMSITTVGRRHMSAIYVVFDQKEFYMMLIATC